MGGLLAARVVVSAGQSLRTLTSWPGLVLAAAFLLAACTSATATTDTDRPADPAPDFELVLFQTANHDAGDKIRLSQFRGQPVVLNFWYPSCPPCVAEMPELEEAFQKNKSDGVEFVGVQLVGLDTVQDGQEFVDRMGVTYALGPDETGDIIKDYKLTGFPTTVFIDDKQNIARKWTGILNAEKIEELVQELLN